MFQWLRNRKIHRLEKVLAEFQVKAKLYDDLALMYRLGRYYSEHVKYKKACERIRKQIKKLKGQ